MQLTATEKEDVLKTIRAFKTAHEEHPESRALVALHERAWRLWGVVKPMLAPEQVAEIEAAAAPKTPPPNDGG